MLCLPKENADAFKKALKNGEIKIAEIMKMTTDQRVAAFGKVVGPEYAEAVNLMFENKLLLKNQQAGLIDWIKTVGSLKPEVRNDLIAKIQRREKAFTASDEKQFLNDVADATLGTTVTREEATKIFELTKKVEAAKTYTGIKDIEDLVTSFEKLDPKTLTAEQSKVIKDLRGKLNAEKAAEEAEAAKIAAEKQAIKEKAAAERQAVREQKVAEEKIIKEKKLEAKELERENTRIQNEVEKEFARIDRAEKMEEEAFERETARLAKKEDIRKLQEATGESLKKMKKIFTDMTGQKFKGIEQFGPKTKAQLEDIVAKREAIANGEDRMIYGRAKVELENYVNSLTAPTEMEQFKASPIRYVAGTAKSLKATLDDSVLGRQGLKTLFTNPKLWGPNAAKTFIDIYKTMRGKEVMNEIRADIVSRPNYQLYKEMKLAVGVREEQHPTSLIEKVPYLGRLAKASENAFAGFMMRMRADLADRYIQIYKNNGMDLTDKMELESLGKLINSQTARGSLGRLEPAADVMNVAFFSIRKLKADIDTLTLHAFDKNFSKTARKYAAYNLIKIIAGIAGVLGIAKAMDPDSVDFDPRSADFGKIKIGDTRFDVSGGMSSLVTLAARISPVLTLGLLQPTSKSSVTGDITPINSDQFGASSVTDVIGDFLANKESPIMSLFHHVLNQKGADNKPITVGGELNNLFVPLPISNAIEVAQAPDGAPFIAAIIADGLGIGTNTYSRSMKKQHEEEVTDAVKKNYQAKQSGGETKSARTIAQEIYGKGFDDSQENAVQKEMDFYRAFGEDNKLANEIHDANQANDVIDLLDEAKDEMEPAEFRKFYSKAQDAGLISTQMNTKWEKFLDTGENPDSDTNLDGSKEDRKVIDIITTFAQAAGTSPMQAFKLLFQNQSIRRIDNGQIIINRNTNFFDREVGKSGYSEEKRKELDASKDQRLDHVIPVAGGGLEKGGDASNLQLISEADWKSNSQVENYLGNALREKKVTGDELREYIIRYKAGQEQPLSPELQKEYQKEYAGVPLSFDEIKQLVK